MKAKGRVASGDRHGMRLHPERVARGEKQWMAKLTDDCVAKILELGARGSGQQAIADEFGVTRRNIRFILAGKTGKHVPRTTGCGR